MTPCRTIEEALRAIREYDGPADGFRLAVADGFMDPTGVNMAVVTDAVLARGWLPDGFEENGSDRIYRYREAS